jgi:hypothetical protein
VRSWAAFIFGVLVGLAAWGTWGTQEAWGYWVFIAAFVGGVTLINMHEGWFGRREKKAEAKRESWTVDRLAQMLAEWDRPEIGASGVALEWTSEEIIEWWNTRSRPIDPWLLSDSRWPWRRRKQAGERQRWIDAYVRGLEDEQKQRLLGRLQSSINWLRQQEGKGPPSDGPPGTAG